jgi:hypothetical protein
MAQHYFSFSTLNGRFVVCDSLAMDGQPTAPAVGAERLTVASGLVGIGTVESTTQVALTIDTVAHPPEDPVAERWAFVAECALRIDSGELVVASDSARVRSGRGAAVLALNPGDYRLRVACDRGRDAPVVAGGAETYHIVLWPV